jgi:sensor domain CHASE-containing protein
MSIKHKSMILVLIILAVTVLGLYPVVSRVLLSGFSRLEEQDAANNSQRLKAAFTSQYEELTTKTADWAYWDDAFEFVRNKDIAGDFIKSNFTESVYSQSQLNLIAYLDLSGGVIFAREYDPVQNKQVPPSRELLRFLARKELWQHTAPDDSISGMILLPQGPFIFAAVPVSNTDGNSPHVGTALMGRYFGQERIKVLSETTRLSCTFGLTPAETQQPEFKQFVQSWRQKQLLLLRPDETTISAISVIEDFDKNALFYRVDLPRNIYREARLSMAWTFWVLLFAGAAVGILTYLLLNRIVISRIQHIHSHLKTVIAANNYDSLLEVRGDDEIAGLSESINGLLAAESTILSAVPEFGKTES